MTRKAKIWLSVVPAVVASLAVVWRVPAWLGLAVWDWRRGLLLGLLAVVVIGGGAAIGILLARRKVPLPPPKDPLSIQIDTALQQAEQRLAAARVVRGRPLQNLPAIFVLGAPQNQKTASVVKSTLQAELLAGDVQRGTQLVPTETINLWFAKQTVLIELGNEVTRDADRFARVLHRLQPAQIGTALTRGVQAPRVAIVCCNCEKLLGPGAREAMIALGRALRVTVGGIAETYGVRLPVYVLFTKADALPGFKEYVKHFSADETREVLGATVPLPNAVAAADYAAAATARYEQALGELYESLARRRVDVLGRGEVGKDRAKAYQFPRTLAKVGPLISEFLVELARPSDLAVNPFIRGFYFSGVREVLVEGSAAGAAANIAVPAMAASAPSDAASATALLAALPMRPAAASAAVVAERSGVTRREAQWVFLDKLYSAVLLSDAAALGTTRGGTRISFFRRAALGTAWGVAAILLIAIVGSFFGNRRLTATTDARVMAVAALPDAPVGMPDLKELATLDSLGAVLDTLSGYVHEGAPLGLRWGLFSGEELYAKAKTAFYGQYARLLFDSTHALLSARLDSVARGSIANAEYSAAYERLKAYLITTDTSLAAKSTIEFLGPALEQDRPVRLATDSVTRVVARRQFDRYARELAFAPFAHRTIDGALIDTSRKFLKAVSGDEPFYKTIVAKVSRRVPQKDFAPWRGRAAGTLVVPYVVPGAFTRPAGLEQVRIQIDSLRQLLKSEEWVLGTTRAMSDAEIDTLKRKIRARYDGAYVQHWQAFVRSARVPGLGSSVGAAAKSLTTLSDNGSPFIPLFTLAHENRPPDTTRFNGPFDPAVKLGAPQIEKAAATEALKPYLEALSAVAAKLKSVPDLDLEADPAVMAEEYQRVLDAVDGVTGAVGGIALKLDPAANAAFGATALLEQPADYARGLLRSRASIAKGAGAKKKANEAGAAFCKEFAPLSSKRPFRLGAGRQDASAGEVLSLLGLNGAMHTQLAPGLGDLVRRRGVGLVPQGGGLTSAAQAFLHQANLLSEALFPRGGSEMQVDVRFAPVIAGSQEAVAIDVLGRPTRFERGENAQLKLVTWRPSPGNAFAIRVPPDGLNIRGEWAMLAAFEDAKWSPNGETVSFDGVRTVPFRVEMSPAVSQLVRLRLFPDSVVCPNEWVR